MSTPEVPEHSIVSPLLVGRSRELNTLVQQLDKVQHGQGATVLLTGEAGIGKSRLVVEVKTIAVQSGFLVSQGSCFEPDRVVPYAPLLDLVRRYFTDESLAQVASRLQPYAAQFIHLLPELAAYWPATIGTTTGTPEQEKHRLFDALLRFVTESTTKRLVVIEDVHWCDELSLEFLLYFARRIHQHRILLLLTYRDDEAAAPLRQWLAHLDRERLTIELSLARLTTTETADMLHAILRQGNVSEPTLVTTLYALTDGNPFFIEEVLKSLFTAGKISANGHWQPTPSSAILVPRTVKVAIAQRMGKIGGEAQHLLMIAAVVGRHFDFSLVQAITGHSEQTLVQMFKELLHSHLIIEESADVFAFRHALSQQAVYSNLLQRERQVLHRTVAEAIEELYAGTLEAKLCDLAFHYHQAGVWAKSFSFARQAGERALALYASHAALEQFDRAFAALPYLPEQSAKLQASLHRLRGQAYELRGEFEKARADYESVLAVAHSESERTNVWQAYMDLGFLWAQRNYERAGHYFRQARAAVEQLDEPVLRAHTLKRLGNWYMNVDQPEEAILHLYEALNLFKALNNRQGIAETFDLLGCAYYASANAITGSHYYEQAIAHFRALDDRGGELGSLLIYAQRHAVYANNVAVWDETPIKQRIADGERALQMARTLDTKAAEVLGLIWQANSYGLSGDYSRAIDHVQKGLSGAEQIEHVHLMATGHMVLGMIYWEMLLWSEAEQHLNDALILAQQSNSLIWLGGIIGYLASTQVQQGRLNEAEHTLAQQWRSDMPMSTKGQRQLWCTWAELSLARRQSQEAREIVERLIASDPHTPTHGEQAIPRLVQLHGQALASLKEFARAEAILMAGQQVATLAPSQRWRLYLTLGNVYRRRKQQLEANQAYTSARLIVEDIATRISDPHLRQSFVTQTSSLFPAPTAIQAAKRSSGGLTSKERTVASLVAQGKSNKEIADTMVVSYRTVETHISNILSKLHLISRAQLAVWVRENNSRSE